MSDALAVSSAVAAAWIAADRRDFSQLELLWAAEARGRDALLPVGDVASLMFDAHVMFESADQAQVRYRLLLANKGAQPGISGCYDCCDQLRRSEGRWRLTERSVAAVDVDVIADLESRAAAIG